MKLTKRNRHGGLNIDMTPMIDVVFLLLIFFMTISQISEVKKERIDLPELPGSEEQLPSSVTVNVNEKGQILVDQRRVTVAQFAGLMRQEKEKVQDPGLVRVVLRADQRATCQTVNQIVKQLGQLQIRKVRIAVRVP